MIQDLISAKTYFFLLPYFFSISVNTLWQNKVFKGGCLQAIERSGMVGPRNTFVSP
jgi:hypothetical protein